ncbi:Apolipoprotein n-acyltransferase [Salix suchowensis]|nr:Apolipoprotein n-acyltransferase [Salix suchowensis]
MTRTSGHLDTGLRRKATVLPIPLAMLKHTALKRRDGDEKDRKADRKHSPPEGSKLQHATSSSSRRLERANSTSTRPTSELPPTADLNALRAREAWEMDRLWKARSMYGSDPNNLAPAPSSIASATSYMVTEATTHGAVHGSSHTAFMVPTPFQHHPGHIYNSMPNGPAPIIYAAPHGAQYQHHPQQYPHTHSYPQSYTSSDTLSMPPASRSNPLPDPPRESTIILDHNGRPTEYWTKYTGVTTAH